MSRASAARDIEKPWSTTSHKTRNCSIFISDYSVLEFTYYVFSAFTTAACGYNRS
jgi:hypothetical protein